MPCKVEIQTCLTDADFVCARKLTKDYIRWLDMDLAFQNIEAELAHFASMYGPPDGLFLLAWYGGEIAGGVGLRRFGTYICEMKRLFVYDGHRREGIGWKLSATLIQEAIRMGYKKMRLDTLAHMQGALRLYQRLGFKEIAPYRFNPHPTAKYMELCLREA